MKREILNVAPGYHTTGCCPGHDDYPADSYNNRRSKHARARDKAKEHRHARRVLNKVVKNGIFDFEDSDIFQGEKQ